MPTRCLSGWWSENIIWDVLSIPKMTNARFSETLVEWKRNLVAHGDAREEKWRGKKRMEWVASSLQHDSEQSIQCYYNRSPPTRTPRKPVLDWTDTPADTNGLVRFAGRPNLVSARVPSRSVCTLTSNIIQSVCLVGKGWLKERCGLEPRTNFFFRLKNRQKLVRIRFENIRYLMSANLK